MAASVNRATISGVDTSTMTYNGIAIPIPSCTAEALYMYSAGTSYGKLCGTSDPAVLSELSAWDLDDNKDTTWGEAHKKRLATVSPSHPICAIFNTPVSPPSRLADTDLCLSKCISSVCGPANAKSVNGYDVLRMGREILGEAHLPVRLILHLQRESSLSADWATCSRLACACVGALQERGISNVHCLVFEVEVETHTVTQRSGSDSGAARPSPSIALEDSSSSSFVPVKLEHGDWARKDYYVDHEMLLRISDNIGMPIASLTNPNKSGTGGIYIRLGSTDGGSTPPAGSQKSVTYLFTNRNVICEDTETRSIRAPSPGDKVVDDGSEEALAVSTTATSTTLKIEMTQSPADLKEVLKSLNNTIASKETLLDKRGNHEPSDYSSSELNKIERLREIHHYYTAHKEPSDRRIGEVEFSPPIGKHCTGYRRDWALVRCAHEGANLSCIYGLRVREKTQLRWKLRPEFGVTVEAAEEPCFDFIKLEGFFTRDTIKQYWYPTIPTNARKDGEHVEGAIVASDYDANEGGKNIEKTIVAPGCDMNENEAQLKEEKLLVYKCGAKTSSTCGMLNCISSRTVEDGNVSWLSDCIISLADAPCFAYAGDSGSAIFGLLPVPFCRSSSDAYILRMVNKGGEGKISEKWHGYTPGIVGLVWGTMLSCRSGRQDVTYATPIEDVLDDIKKYTGRDIVNIQPY